MHGATSARSCDWIRKEAADIFPGRTTAFDPIAVGNFSIKANSTIARCSSRTRYMALWILASQQNICFSWSVCIGACASWSKVPARFILSVPRLLCSSCEGDLSSPPFSACFENYYPAQKRSLTDLWWSHDERATLLRAHEKCVRSPTQSQNSRERVYFGVLFHRGNFTTLRLYSSVNGKSTRWTPTWKEGKKTETVRKGLNETCTSSLWRFQGKRLFYYSEEKILRRHMKNSTADVSLVLVEKRKRRKKHRSCDSMQRRCLLRHSRRVIYYKIYCPSIFCNFTILRFPNFMILLF